MTDHRGVIFEAAKSLIVDQVNPCDYEVGVADAISPDTPLRGAPLWLDELDIVEIEIGLEIEFAIDIPDGDTDAVVTVGDLVAYIATRISARAGAAAPPSPGDPNAAA